MKPPLEVVQTLLSDPTNINLVRSLTTEDMTYVSSNFNNPELHQVFPWAGTNRGPQSMVDVFNGVGRTWEQKAFEDRDVIDNEHSVAMFGSFPYKSRNIGTTITSHFAVIVTSSTGDTPYFQLL